MSPRAIRIVGLLVSAAGAALVLWLYAAQPENLAEVRGGLTSSVGLYRIDEQAFSEGLTHFRADRFVEARLAFDRADPARRDATTQFYLAYAFYRQGWGRVYNDDGLFRAALEALDRAEASATGGQVVVDDPDLKLRSSDLLRAELQRGLTRDWSDLNPLRVLRERQ